MDGRPLLVYTHGVDTPHLDPLSRFGSFFPVRFPRGFLIALALAFSSCGPSVQQRACRADCQRNADNCLLAATTSDAVAACDRASDSCIAKCP